MYKYRLFVVSSGVFSLIVFVYAALIHGTMIVWGLVYPNPTETSALFSSIKEEPIIIALHVVVCLLGPLLAIIFIRHAYRNPQLGQQARGVWAVALVIGYGLIFYWYRYIRNRGGSARPLAA